MPEKIEVVVFGCQNTVLQTTLSVLGAQKQFQSATALNDYIPVSSDSTHYVLVFLDPIDEHLKSIMKEFGQKKQVIQVLMCNNKSNPLVHKQKNVEHISTLLVTYEVTYSIMKFLTEQLREYYYARHAPAAKVDSLRQEIEIMKLWLTSSNLVEHFHVLLIPLNVTMEHFLGTRKRMTDLCKKICSKDVQGPIKVSSIYDFIPPKSFNDEQAEHMTSFGHRQLSEISHLLSHFRGITMILVGNEKRNLDDFASLIIAKINDNTLQSSFKYKGGCTLIADEQYEPISPKVKNNYLPNIRSWQLQNRTLKNLEDLETDRDFKADLLDTHRTRESDQVEMNREFQQLLKTFLKNSLKSYEDGKKSQEVDDIPNGMPEGFQDPISNQIQTGDEHNYL